MRRGRVEIWADILQAVEREQRARPVVRPTRVRAAANLPYARWMNHLTELESRGLVDVQPLRLTTQGRAFLRRAQALDGAMKP